MYPSRVKYFLILISITLVSSYGGYYVGNLKTERTFEKLFYLDEANKLTVSVQTLSALRFGSQELAIRLLESRADTSLIILERYKEKAELEKLKPVLASLKLASVYRKFYKDEYEAVIGKEKYAGTDQIQKALSYGSKVESSDYENFIKKYLTHK